MQKLLVAVITLALVLVALAVPAQGDHANSDMFRNFSDTGDRWNESVTRELCVSPELWTELSPESRADNAYDSAWTALNRWVGSTQINQFFQTRDVCANFGFATVWNDTPGATEGERTVNFCADVPVSQSSFQLDNLDNLEVINPGRGYAVTCDTDDNGRIDWAVVVVAQDLKELFNFNFDAPPTEGNPIDGPGVMVHEFGHFFGFDEHMGSPCPFTNVDWETMCAGSFGVTYNSGGSQANRDLEEHDIAEVNSAEGSGGGY